MPPGHISLVGAYRAARRTVDSLAPVASQDYAPSVPYAPLGLMR